MTSPAESIVNGIAILCFIGGMIGWLLVWAGLLGDSSDDNSMPRDAEWLDRIPPWLQILTLGVVIILLFTIIRFAAQASLIP